MYQETDDSIKTSLTGAHLLNHSFLNKGSAFTREEREELGLVGLLPYQVNTLEKQVERAYTQYKELPSPLLRNAFLASLHDQNDVLFFRLLEDHLRLMLPVIYTPTEGDAIEHYSHEFRRPRGIYLTLKEPLEEMDKALAHHSDKEIDLIIVSDSEEILGIGDQGVGGIGITVAKALLYTIGAGVHPARTLPVVLDVGTDNKDLLDDPLYMGWVHPRVRGKQYDDFVDAFVERVQKFFPHSYLHWEDFGLDNARRLLEKYHSKMLTFNDDIQGTGVVCLAALMAALKVRNVKLTDQRIVVFGAGTAGTGIADQLRGAMHVAGLSDKQAVAQIWCVDKPGLLVESHGDHLTPAQKIYARPDAEQHGWNLSSESHDKLKYTLLDVIENVHPTVLIGCSTAPKSFTETHIRTMKKHCDEPIIFPLSNPTRLVEATPQEVMNWTKGSALVATGSPFPPTTYAGVTKDVAECNNVLAYPGIGLGAITAKAKVLTDTMIFAAVKALAECSPATTSDDTSAALLPGVEDVRGVSVKVASAVMKQAIKEGVAGVVVAEDEVEPLLRKKMWEAKYKRIVHVE